MKHQIDFVYFDLGNVLVSFDPDIACRNLVERFGVSKRQSWQAIYDSGIQDEFEHGHINGEEFARQIRHSLGVTETRMSTERLLDAVSDMFTPIDVMADVLKRVRENGYGVGLLSNTCHAHWDWICRQSYSMNEFRFDVIVLSYEEGAMKPDSAIYEVAEKKARVPGENLLFLDDKLENIEAARSRNWRATCCRGGQEAIQALQEFGVLGQAETDR